MRQCHRRYTLNWRRFEKWELMYQRPYTSYHTQNQIDIVFNWAKIRAHLEVKPEFPAGLHYYLWEIFNAVA